MIEVPDRLTMQEFADLIVRETDRVELKIGVSAEKVQDAMVAFSNAAGGVIFIGVKDDRTVVGRALDQGTDDAVHAAARSARDLGRYRVAQVQVGSQQVVAVTVWPRQEGFAQTSGGRVLQRRGAANPALMGDELWTFMAARAHQRFESSESGLSLDTVEAHNLIALTRAYGWPDDLASLSERLTERRLTTAGGQLTVAGALLMTDPAVTLGLGKAHIDVRRYPDETGDYDRRVPIGGTLSNQIAQATQFIMDELGTDMVVSGAHRLDVPKLPEVVIREVVANAVAHRSYEIDRVSIRVDLRPGRIEVVSPGKLPEPVTIETIRFAQAARNPTVIDTLRKFHLAEDAGRGIDVIEDSMSAALLDPPIFAEIGNAVSVILPTTGPMSAQERAWVADIDRRSGLSGAERVLLVHAARGETLTNARAREILTTDALSVRKSLRHLVDVGLLESSGERAGTRYDLARRIGTAAQFRMRPHEMRRLILRTAAMHPVSNEDVRRLTGVNRDEALAVLRQLVADGALRASGQKRGTRYHAT